MRSASISSSHSLFLFSLFSSLSFHFSTIVGYRTCPHSHFRTHTYIIIYNIIIHLISSYTSSHSFVLSFFHLYLLSFLSSLCISLWWGALFPSHSAHWLLYAHIYSYTVVNICQHLPFLLIFPLFIMSLLSPHLHYSFISFLLHHCMMMHHLNILSISDKLKMIQRYIEMNQMAYGCVYLIHPHHHRLPPAHLLH